VTSLLELAVWKEGILNCLRSERRRGANKEERTSPSSSECEEFALSAEMVLSSKTSLKDVWKSEIVRDEAFDPKHFAQIVRITCGSDIIIREVSKFL